MGNVIEIPDESMKKGFRLVTLFEEAVAEQDDYGLWQVKLECTQKAMKYFFNIENLGYLRYKLRCITSLTSRYTYIMFIYLEANRFRKSWDVPLDELKQILDCDKEETYKAFKRFNDLILKKVQIHLILPLGGIGPKNVFRRPFTSFSVVNIQGSPRDSILRM